MKTQLTNYHTHTYRCHHATGTAVDYARAAVQRGFSILGISDHSPLPDNRWPEVRMQMGALSGYIDEIETAAARYRGIMILKGLECEYAPEYSSFYADELLGRYRCDYLIGGAHYFPVTGGWIGCYSAEDTKKNLHAYSDYIINSIQSGLFAFIAHPDLFGNFYLKWDEETISCSRAILDAASQADVALEINGYGYRKSMIMADGMLRRRYPLDRFWELAKDYDVSVIINSDAHRPEDLDSFGDAAELAERHSLRIITDIFN